MPRTLTLQNQIRSTTSGIEYEDTLNLTLAESVINEEYLSDPAQVSGTVINDLNYIRTALRDIKGAAPTYNWFDPIPATGGLLSLSSARTEISNLQTFAGSDGDGDTTPTYSSTTTVTQNTDLEAAIGELDAALSTVSGTPASGTSKRVLVRTGNGVHSKNATLDIETPGSGWSASGDSIAIADSSSFLDEISVFVNGVLQLNGVDSSADNDVYFVSAPSSIAFEYNINKNTIVQIWKLPSA